MEDYPQWCRYPYYCFTHLFSAQLINRVAWDGALIEPDANELGWKETFRVNPLEHTIIAMRPNIPIPQQVPFEIPNSIRVIDPTMPEVMHYRHHRQQDG